MKPVRVRRLVLVATLCALPAFVGCTATGEQAGPQNTESTQTTSTSSPATTVSLRGECLDVADKARVLLTEAGRLATGDGTIEQVRAAAGGLSDSFEDARTALGPDAEADLDTAGQALQRVQDVLTTQPVDNAELRAAANDFVAALTNAAAVCAPGAPTAPTTGTAPDTTDTTPEPTPTS